MNSIDTERLIAIAHYQYIMQAQSAKLFLEEQGIPAAITGAEIVVADWGLGNAVGGIRVEVLESYVERATEILSRMSPASTLGEVGRESESIAEKCLACGAEFSTSSALCQECGWTFISDDFHVDDEPHVEARNAGGSSLKRMRWLAKIWIQFYISLVLLLFVYQFIWLILFRRWR